MRPALSLTATGKAAERRRPGRNGDRHQSDLVSVRSVATVTGPGTVRADSAVVALNAQLAAYRDNPRTKREKNHASPSSNSSPAFRCRRIALAACSAVDRIENIGEPPTLAPIANPAGAARLSAGHDADRAGAHRARIRPIRCGRRFAQLLPRSARQSCRRHHHDRHLGRRCGENLQHHAHAAAPIRTTRT